MTERPEPASPPPPLRRRGWIGLLLAGSLALNLFLIGILAGGWLAQRPGDGFDPAGGPGFVPHMIRSLPQGAREAAVDRFVERRGAIRRQMIGLRQARRSVYSALTAEEFDRAELETALAGLREQVSALQAGIHEAIVEVASQLDAEDRQQMAETLRGLARGRGFGQGRPGMRPGRGDGGLR